MTFRELLAAVHRIYDGVAQSEMLDLFDLDGKLSREAIAVHGDRLSAFVAIELRDTILGTAETRAARAAVQKTKTALDRKLTPDDFAESERALALGIRQLSAVLAAIQRYAEAEYPDGELAVARRKVPSIRGE